MKIALFLYSMDCGGAERVAVNLCNHWVSLGHELTIVTLVGGVSDFYEIAPGVRRISLSLDDESGNPFSAIWHNFRRVKAYRQVLAEVKPDVAIALMRTSSVLLGLASRGMAVKTIGCEHNHPPQRPSGFMWETLRKYTYGLLGAVTGLTNKSRDWLKNNTNAKQVVTMPNPVSWPLPTGEPRIAPEDVYPAGQKRLLSIGRFCKEKAFHRLIDAFSLVAEAHPDWSLAIVGDGALRPELERQVQRLGLQNRVFLPGRAGNVGEWYDKADLYVMSSQSEGFPMTLVEAMSSGLPVVSFDCDTGPRDIISHETNGLLVAPENVEELSKALARLMVDEALRSQYASQAVVVREVFSMAKISDMWDRLFNGIKVDAPPKPD